MECSGFRWSRRTTKVVAHTTSTSARKLQNQVPIEDCPKAWTELTIPERVSSVPKMQSRKVEKRSQIFHVFIIPRFSCIMVECRKAVPVSHGISDAFSTGSQPQYPPHPSTA